jgi:hypothetical protein
MMFCSRPILGTDTSQETNRRTGDGTNQNKLTRITQYKTKDYAGGEQIIDIDLSASG